MSWQLLFDDDEGKPHSTLDCFCSSALRLLRELQRKALPLPELPFPHSLFNPPARQLFSPLKSRVRVNSSVAVY